ncbi:MAG: DNA translocase FtsK [Bacteroidales bacterium]|jgi:S-DNA-T family DNA segregation ATPase FtsK/SpoIIIE|nr:DNA translocase FtsK [Bacteroidales bacterium]
MAKKEQDKPKEKKKSFLSDNRVKIVFGIFIIFLSVFLTIAFISYLFTWKADQSFEFSAVFSDADVVVENWSGKAGAWIANQFINKWFGIASFTLPFILFVTGLRFLHFRLYPLRKTLKIVLIGTILFSVLFGFVFGTANGFLGSGLGGAHGYFIAQWLNSLVGKPGTAFILIVLFVAFAVFTSDLALNWIQKLIDKILQPKAASQLQAEENIESVENPENKPEFDSLQINTDNFEEEVIDEKLVFTTRKITPENNDINVTLNEDNNIELTIEPTTTEESTGEPTFELKDYDPTLDLSQYKFPSIDLLDDYSKNSDGQINKDEIIANKDKIVETLANYKIQIDKIKATVGPTVTLYEIIPAPGVRISKIKNLEDDIALSLSALGIRIIAPIPGRGTIGIEVPNQNPEIVSMKSIITSKNFADTKYDLAIGLGKTISNETFVFDLAKMPHLLVAGATGQGKSVGLNAIIASLLYKKHPSQLKFVMIDPKKVELTLYSKIERHFLAKLPDSEEPIITDTQKVVYTLNSLCIEMDQRYDLLKLGSVRNIKEYNAKFIARKLNPELGHRYLPYIVVIVDEFADLIMTAGREIEGPLTRLAQLARAIGIHLVIATQRPSTNIITGTIKANFPARLAFRVSSMIDSRTILDSPGANQLIGRGDMLITSGSDLVRLQCAFIDTPELEKIVDFIGSQRGYPIAYPLPEYTPEGAEEVAEVDLSKRDALFDDAARLVVRHQQGSTSLIQRKFSIGYNRAGRIIDQLEAANIVGKFEGSKARQVLFADEYSLEQYLRDFADNN